MPSGAKTFTYMGDEPSIEVQGVVLNRDEPTVVSDQGAAAVLETMDEVCEGAAELPAAEPSFISNEAGGTVTWSEVGDPTTFDAPTLTIVAAEGHEEPAAVPVNVETPAPETPTAPPLPADKSAGTADRKPRRARKK